MLKDGTYVCLGEAPNTRMGTVSQGTIEAGKVKYVMHFDERLSYDSMPDLYVFDYDIQECARPTDAEVDAINALIKRGS